MQVAFLNYYRGARSVLRAIVKFNFHVADRLFEWYAAGVMCLMAISMATPGTRMTGAFAVMLEWGFSKNTFLFFFSVFGTTRIFALIANGNLKYGGPRVRAFCAFISVPVWCLLAMALVREWIYSGELSLGVAVYLPLMLCDMYAAKRATLDVGHG